MTVFAVATEDVLSEVVAETLLHQVSIRDIQVRLRKEGFGYLRSRIADFNRIAEKVMPVLLITDLDRNRCPPRMIADWLPVSRSPRLLFQIAVRETESWVLANRTAFARFIGVSVAVIPTAPDERAIGPEGRSAEARPQVLEAGVETGYPAAEGSHPPSRARVQ